MKNIKFEFDFAVGGISGMATMTAEIGVASELVTSHGGRSLYVGSVDIKEAEIESVGTDDETEFPAEWIGELLEIGKEKLREAIESGKEL